MSKKKYVNREESALIALLFCTVAAVAGFFFVGHYYERAKSTREVSLDSNEPTLVAGNQPSFQTDLEFREQARKADELLLELLREKRAKFESEPTPQFQRQQFLQNYKRSIVDASRILVGQPGLRGDFQKQMEDFEFTSAR